MERIGDPSQLAFQQGEGQGVEPAAAEFGWDIRSEQALLDGALLDLFKEIVRDPVQFFDDVFVGQKFALNEGPSGLDDHVLFFRR